MKKRIWLVLALCLVCRFAWAERYSSYKVLSADGDKVRVMYYKLAVDKEGNSIEVEAGEDDCRISRIENRIQSRLDSNTADQVLLDEINAFIAAQ